MAGALAESKMAAAPQGIAPAAWGAIRSKTAHLRTGMLAGMPLHGDLP